VQHAISCRFSQVEQRLFRRYRHPQFEGLFLGSRPVTGGLPGEDGLSVVEPQRLTAQAVPGRIEPGERRRYESGLSLR
jgi:hypothetical protein